MKIFTVIAATALLIGSTYAGSAAPKKAMAAAKTLKCPSCGMPMPTKASKATPVPVKVGKTTYFCCAHCPSGMKAAAAAHKMHKMHKM